jgi:hypothetical protein
VILALTVVAGLAAAIVAAVALKRGVLNSHFGVPLVAAVPLAGWLLMQFMADPARSAHELEVLGQYHRLSDTLRIATDRDADVVLSGDARDAALDVAFDATSQQLRVYVERASVPLLLGERPVNAIPLGAVQH